MTGKKLDTATEKWLHASISVDLGTGLGMEDELAEEAAKRCVPVLLNLREKLRQCLESTGAKAYNANIGKEMRIAVGADTNVAVDNILGYLVGGSLTLSPFRTNGCLTPLKCCVGCNIDLKCVLPQDGDPGFNGLYSVIRLGRSDKVRRQRAWEGWGA